MTIVLLLFGLFLILFSPPAHAATFVVDRTDDEPTASACTGAPNDCSLRGAIIAANGDGFLDTITLPAGTYVLTQVGTGEGAALNGDLDVNSDLSIVGAGSGTTTIDGNGGVTGEHVFTFYGDKTVDITGVTITGGTGVSSGGAIIGFGPLTLTDVVITGNAAMQSGGAIYTSTSLTMDNCELSFNYSGNQGGAIFAFKSSVTITNSTLTDNHALGSSSGGAIATYSHDGSHVLTITDSLISDNDAGFAAGAILSNTDTVTLTRVTLSGNDALGGSGGAIYKADDPSFPGLITITDSTIDSNTADGAAGGLYLGNYTSGVIEGSTISNNSAASEDANDGGGAIKHTGLSLAITDSTLSGNSATNFGGGLLTYSINAGVTLTNVTITDNTADSDSAGGGDGGGIYAGYGPISLENSIIAGNAGNQCAYITLANLTSLGHNISSDASCNLVGTGDLTNTDPQIEPLTENGGSTETHALPPGSPAIDAANTAACSSTDQRDWPRPIGPECDIGAYEAPIWIWLPLISK
jgi:CSLREA domain-containing protein